MSGSGPACPWGKAATPGVILIDCYLDTLDTWQKSGDSFICLSVCLFVFVDTWQNPTHGQVPMSFDHSKASPSVCVWMFVCVNVFLCALCFAVVAKKISAHYWAEYAEAQSLSLFRKRRKGGDLQVAYAYFSLPAIWGKSSLWWLWLCYHCYKIFTNILMITIIISIFFLGA